MADRRLFVDTAAGIGERIARQAVWRDGACTWRVVRPDPASGGEPVREQADGTLYQGASGIALFLAELYAHTREPRFAEAAEGGLRFALRAADELPAGACGFHAGRTGIAYAAARLSQVIDDPAWLAEAARVIEPLRGRAEDDAVLDVVGGAAGAIPALLRLNGWLGSEPALETARELGGHLLRAAEPQRAGWGWTPARPLPFTRPLLGMAHGAAGIGLALAELYAATGEEECRYGAERAFAYERAAYDPEEENWPDFRETDVLTFLQRERVDELRERVRRGWRPPVRHLTAWCHGAPGIGLSRLRAWELLGDGACRQDALAAVETTRAWVRANGDEPTSVFCLCHGIAGNGEVLLHAAEILELPALRDEVEEIVARRCAEGSSGPWISGAPRGLSDPSLMLGEAGIGHFLLRLAGAAAESPLLLRPPAASPSPSLTGEAYARLSQRDAQAWFGRTLDVFARLGVPLPTVEEPPALETVRAAIQQAIDGEADPQRRAWLEDVVRLEDEHAALLAEEVRPVLPFLGALLQPAEADWQVAAFRLAAGVRLARTEWDWDAWLESDAEGPPPAGPAAYAVHVTEWGPEWTRISPLAFHLLRALGEEGATIAAVAARLEPEAYGDAPDDMPRARIAEELRSALEEGLVWMVSGRGGGPPGGPPGEDDRGPVSDEAGPSSLWAHTDAEEPKSLF
jgi:hypothetical protein